MEHLDELHNLRPLRIDVYADGSWLFKGKNNPTEAGGWGAAVLETYANGQRLVWLPSAPASPQATGAHSAEIEAAVGALHAVKTREEHRPSTAPMPAITLFTDQTSFTSCTQTLKNTPQKLTGNLRTLAELATELKAKIVYASHNKGKGADKETDAALMDIPHTLASRESWRQRMEKQDGTLKFGPDTITLTDQESRDLFVNRMFRIKIPPLQR